MDLLKLNCEEQFHIWFEEIAKFAETLAVDVSVAGFVKRQVHRGKCPGGNVLGDSPEEYYRRNIVIPVLDYTLVEMHDRFGGIHQQIVKPLGLFPSIVATGDSSVSLEEVANLYKEDHPSPPLVSTEYWQWKDMWSSKAQEERPDTLLFKPQRLDLFNHMRLVT